METKPGDAPPGDGDARPVDAGAGNLFEQRAHRSWFVNGVVVLCLAAVAWSAWPTESRQLERRAKAYLSAAFRGEAKQAYEFLAPASRQRLPMDIWWQANKMRLANSEVVDAKVEGGGQTATVTLKDTRSGTTRPTAWVKDGGAWHHDYDGK